MPALYQPLRPLFGLTALLAIAGCSAGCAGEAGDAATPIERAREWPLAVHLEARSFEPVGVEHRGTLVAQETGADGGRPIRLDGQRPPVAMLAATGVSARAVAVLSGGVVVESAAGDLALVDDSGTLRRFAAGERWLAAARDGRRLWTARFDAGVEALIERSLPGLGAVTVLRAPPAFRISAVARDGARAALVRSLHDEADEVVIVDRASDERRLVLPSGPDGRFRPLLFDEEGTRLLLLADDGGDLSRLEWLDVAGGARVPALESPCAALDARGHGARIVATIACDGVRRVVPLAAGDAPWDESLPDGTRALGAIPGDAATWWLAIGGPRAERDLALLPVDRVLVPLTWGLPPRLEPQALATPEPVRIPSVGASLPAELWRPPGRPTRAALVWLEAAGPPDWGRFDPFFSALAGRGIAVLRLRGRGSDGFGRTLRRAGDGDPVGATEADLAAAAREVRERSGLGAGRLGLVGVGPWPGALAAASAAAGTSPFDVLVAIDPDPDPLALLETLTEAPEPLRSALVARWGDPTSRRSVELRAALAEAASRSRRPLLVLLDDSAPATAGRRAALESAVAAGRPLTLRIGPRPAFAQGPGSAALRATWEHLLAGLLAER